jgi:DNA-binding NtrC family response regulator
LNGLDHSFRIFFVDDEPGIANTTAQILQMEGFDCVSFCDPLALIVSCEETPPDLVISDIIMPQMNGFDLASLLLASYPQCKILLFTGQAGVEDLREYASELGHDIEVLSKPLHPQKLIEKVRMIEVEERQERTQTSLMRSSGK